MTSARRALLLVLSALAVFVGVTVVNVLYTDHVDRSGQRDMCDLINAIIPSAAPSPASERERQRTAAIEHYRSRRCSAHR